MLGAYSTIRFFYNLLQAGLGMTERAGRSPFGEKIKHGVVAVLSLLLLYKASEYMLKGTGLEIIKIDILLLCIFLIILNSSRKAFYFLALPIVIFYALYSPFGSVFGPPNYAYLVSIFGTDHVEAREFLYQIPNKYYKRAVLIVPFFLAFRYLTVKHQIEFHKNKTVLILSVFLMILLQKPFMIFHKMHDAYQETFSEKNKLLSFHNDDFMSKHSISSVSTIDDYVLIIGESARRDYMNIYGYALENTPFLSASNAHIVNGLTSAAESTIASLRLMLTKPNKTDWTPNYNYNLIDLANLAGFETYWISNQGMIGKHDTPISVIATKSKETFFLKKAGYSSRNTSDFELLPYFKEAISVKEGQGKKRLFVFHLYGSHPDPCQRVVDFEMDQYIPANDRLKTIACYVASIHKTDMFISKVYDVLQNSLSNQKRSFSLVYFSDHGLAHLEENGHLLLSHVKGRSPEQFRIPLVRIDSGYTKVKECDSFKSALNFTEGLATWMGIRSDFLNPHYDLFDCKDDPKDYGLGRILNSTELSEDPPVDITKH